jgi:isopentenyl-diphosphate delta-isomerase
VQEELGLNASLLQFDFLFSFFQEAILNETYIDRQFIDVYMTRADIERETIKFDRSEVFEVKFVSFESFRKMVLNPSAGLAPVYANECRDLVYFLGDLFTP